MSELKNIKAASIPRALTKAERYRLLNEPRCAESICRDVLAAQADCPAGLKILILAITDQFSQPTDRRGIGERKEEAEALLSQLPDAYSRHYYSGVVLERWAKGLLGIKTASKSVHGFLVRAMQEYESAAGLASPDNEDAILRWNTCARIIDRYALGDTAQDPAVDYGESYDEVPFRP
jgi:hypothetical protein